MLVQSHLHSAPKLAAGVASLPSTGSAIARRLLVATVACVVVWQLQADDSPPAREFKNILVRLSGRQMKRTRPHTAPALPDRESWTVGQVANLPHSPRAATQASTHAAVLLVPSNGTPLSTPAAKQGRGRGERSSVAESAISRFAPHRRVPCQVVNAPRFVYDAQMLPAWRSLWTSLHGHKV
jgi:hypothetical protein